MPQITVSTNELASTGGVPTNTGACFVAGTTDQGPPTGGPPYVRCASVQDYVNAFGARSSTSAALYDFIDEFFHDGGSTAVAYVTNVTDSTATTASLVLEDSGAFPTVQVSAKTPGTAGNDIHIDVENTGSDFTILIEDSTGDVLESHGPFTTTAELFADTSEYVTFVQATGTGNTTNIPANLASTPLAGGADASDLTDSSYVSALANFPASLGPGTVCLPGRTSATVWNGLDAHALQNNRFSVKDMVDSSSAATVVSAAQAQTVDSASGYGMFIQGSLVLPGITPGTTRTCPGSAAVAALRAQVAATANQNVAPAGRRWPLTYPFGFTEYFGPLPALSLPTGSFSQADVNTMSAGGVNCFANYYGALCLFGFVTPISKTVDAEFWQASSVVERMNLVAQGQAILANYLFDDIDDATITALTGDLSALGQAEYAAGALYGSTPSDAFTVLTGSPVNTAATAQAGQLNAQMQVRLTKYADTVNLLISVVPITEQVAQPTTNAA